MQDSHCTGGSRARLQNPRPGMQSWGTSWLPWVKSWLVWRGCSRSGVSKCRPYKGYFRHSVSLSGSPIKTASWKRAGLFTDGQRAGSLEWVGAVPRKAWYKWVKSSGGCWVGQGTRIYRVETPAGAGNIKGLFQYPPAFSSARLCLPWSSQLYFSGECARMTQARVTDCYLLVILALLLPQELYLFLAQNKLPGLAWCASCAADASN